MSSLSAYEMLYKKYLLDKQRALQTLGETQAQIKVANDRVNLLHRYHQEYSHDLDGLILNGTTVHDFQYFLKFMTHLQKVLSEARAQVLYLSHERDKLQKQYEKIQRESDELQRIIGVKQKMTAVHLEKKAQAQVEDMYITRRMYNGS